MPAIDLEVEVMKRRTPTLILLALLVLVPGAACLAETPAAAISAASPASPPPSLDEFLESLASPGTAPTSRAALSTSTSCTVTGCPVGYKCCYPCGIPDCEWVCMAVRRCPLIP